MKITIDTTAKIITVEESVNIGDLIKELKKILPDYKEFTLVQKETIWQYYPYYPIYQEQNPLQPTWDRTIPFGISGVDK